MNSNMLFANFNQDFTCISVGTRKGYSITNCDPFGRVYTKNDGARGIVEMLFCTSLIALVGAADHPHSSPRKLQIVNTKRQSMICELLFPSSILAVKLNRKTLVIVLERRRQTQTLLSRSHLPPKTPILPTPLLFRRPIPRLNPAHSLQLHPRQHSKPVTCYYSQPVRSPLRMSSRRTRRLFPSSRSTQRARCSRPRRTRARLFAYGAFLAQRSCTSSAVARGRRAYTR